MAKVEKSALQQLAEDAELKVRSYSGRAMYEKNCLGIEGDDICDVYNALFQAAADTEPDLQEIADQLRDARRDQMGRGTILYFPQVEFCDDSEQEEEEDDEEDDYSLEEACDRGVLG